MKTIFKSESQKQLAFFLLKAVLLYFLWVLLYDFVLEPPQTLDAYLNFRVAHEAALILKLFGYQAGTTPGIHQTIVQINTTDMVGVGNPCNGLELFVLFAGFVISFPGKYIQKLWFIPSGIILIHLINSIRAALLALIQYTHPEFLDFNHHYTFTVVVYLFIFYLWIYWANKLSGFNFNSNTSKDIHASPN